MFKLKLRVKIDNVLAEDSVNASTLSEISNYSMGTCGGIGNSNSISPSNSKVVKSS